VRVSLINNISSGLISLARQFSAAQGNAAAFKKELSQIKGLMIASAGLGVAGALIAVPIVKAVSNAAELQKQMLGVQAATRGSTAEMDAMRLAAEKASSVTVFSSVQVAGLAKIMATTSALSASQITAAIPAYTRYADVQYLMKGTSPEESVREGITLAHQAGHFDAASASKYLDLLTKASMVIPGSVTQLGHALKYSQGVARAELGVDDDNMILLTALMSRMGLSGSRGGTNLIAAMTRSIPGIFGSGLLTGKSGEALKAMGMVDAQGQSLFLKSGKFDTIGWIGGLSGYVNREFASHPEGIARQAILSNFQHAFGTQGSRVASLLSTPIALEQLKMIGARMQSAGGVDQIQSMFAGQSVSQQWQDASTNFQNALTELGYTLLPAATKALVALNSQLTSLTNWIHNNQGAAGGIMKGMVGLSALLLLGSLITGVAAALKSLWMVVTFIRLPVLFGALRAALLGVGEAIGGGVVGGVLAVVGELAAGFALAAAAGAVLAVTLKSICDWINNALGIHEKGAAYARGQGPEPPAYISPDSPHLPPGAHARGQGPYVSPAERGKTPASYVVMMDGQKVGVLVSKHQANSIGGPQRALNGFDSSMSYSPIGLSAA